MVLLELMVRVEAFMHAANEKLDAIPSDFGQPLVYGDFVFVQLVVVSDLPIIGEKPAVNKFESIEAIETQREKGVCVIF